ncbi:tRNA-uridine aminocarboxypropyltransferase [Colwellia piezophila]|uniref:tRNA-uridine aminocarboxypropyltransferase n=1 Tax=Colwellia piezophila TaxID=211668 RepID=UPI00035E2F99|nr:tRNA-uridine aminocarboxypropyltransferase [Colwellia piezophila]
MSRTLCQGCQRPEIACICAFTTEIANDIHVVVLQHPSEVSQSKGTVALLAKSLLSCQVIVAENVDEQQAFLDIIAQQQAVLLYPGERAQILTSNLCVQVANSKQPQPDNAKPLCLVILDGTWKKAYRMFMLSNTLQQLPQVCLPDYLADAGQYLIRKVAREKALSSLEACCYALAILENNDLTKDGAEPRKVSPENLGKYQPLLEKFKDFNQFQLSFRPEHKTS